MQTGGLSYEQESYACSDGEGGEEKVVQQLRTPDLLSNTRPGRAESPLNRLGKLTPTPAPPKTPKTPLYSEYSSQDFQNNSPAPAQATAKQPSNSGGNKLVITVVALLVVIVAIVVFAPSKAPTHLMSQAFKANCSELMELNKKFPNQDKKLFKSLRSGVEATVNHKPPEPTVFSLFSTDESLIDKLMENVVKLTQQCIHQQQDPLILTIDHLSDKIITDYEHELRQRNIMIIRDVGEANSETVAALHSICDTENPLVAKSIIFFTLKVPGAPVGKPVDYIFDYLNERWSGLAENIRTPLITRMIDQTFFLKP